MSNKENLEALETTLRLAGVKNFSVDKLNLLEYSEAVPESNQRVYKATNNLIFEELSQGNLGSCIHVTGEMRALTDPFHRQLCEEMIRREKGRFQVLFYAPENLYNFEENHPSPEALVDWNLNQWFSQSQKETHWTEKMRTTNAIANQSVDILAYDTQDKIQYSVFGNRYVLLQEKHTAHAESKRVWLIESDKVNEELSDNAELFIDNSVNIDSSIFRNFSKSLTQLSAYRILSKLKDSKIKEEEILNDRLIKDFSINPLRSLNALKIMKFVEKDENDFLKITLEGIDFSNF
jgi:hypothetical protein